MKETKIPTGKVQLELDIETPKEKDRNFDKGGRSFYFFDFDDNILNLLTPIVLFHKETKEEKLISSEALAKEGQNVGKSGEYQNYEFDYDDSIGSFRYFRDLKLGVLERLRGRKQYFVNDVAKALTRPHEEWKGPSWDYFTYAVYNKRPISIITARGHNPRTIKDGIRVLLNEGHLTNPPNYLSIFPVSNPDIRRQLLGYDGMADTAALKKLAIKKSVETAILQYGNNPHHRFGMSDDDIKNIELITQAMVDLKKEYPLMSFFVFNTSGGICRRTEIFEDHLDIKEDEVLVDGHPSLFDF
ncbi:MAG: hypothetical protein ISR65_02485 [Bacteriovoracaceae bacterium]|nr:hypothetical protein [Bacteriovoracaceae bacterium]